MQKKIWRAVVAVLLISVVAVYAATIKNIEEKTCMGVPVISMKEAQKYNQYVCQDYSNMFFHNGEMAAVDINSYTIYISQNITENTHYNQLVGAFAFAHPDYKLYFKSDEYFDKLSDAVKESHPFELIVTDGSNQFMEYYVIFTTLPVIRITGQESYINEEDRQVFDGDICVWTPYDKQTEGYTVKTSSAEWHVRGDSQKSQPKKPYKLALKKKNGENNNLDMLGLGRDDDWILNSMSFDDVRFRDKLVMDIWNEMCTDTPYNYKMDSGEYVELVDNGIYSGLYLMQRRVDAKYLQLDNDKILLKGRKEFTDPSDPLYYTVVGDSTRQAQATEIMNRYDLGEIHDRIVLDNWIDVNLFVNWGYMSDNIRKHNMYYVLDKPADDLKISLILWDTDMSFGVGWGDGAYTYIPWMKNYWPCNRPEYESLKEIYPGIDSMLADRWKELRSSVLSEENINRHIEEYEILFEKSGAFSRDKARWGEYHNGADTIENFYQFIKERMVVLDNLYGQYS